MTADTYPMVYKRQQVNPKIYKKEINPNSITKTFL